MNRIPGAGDQEVDLDGRHTLVPQDHSANVRAIVLARFEKAPFVCPYRVELGPLRSEVWVIRSSVTTSSSESNVQAVVKIRFQFGYRFKCLINKN